MKKKIIKSKGFLVRGIKLNFIVQALLGNISSFCLKIGENSFLRISINNVKPKKCGVIEIFCKLISINIGQKDRKKNFGFLPGDRLRLLVHTEKCPKCFYEKAGAEDEIIVLTGSGFVSGTKNIFNKEA